MRIDAKITLLMLVPMSFNGRTVIGPQRNTIRNIEIRAGKLLSDCLRPFIQEGIEVYSALKIGNPAQELMKFLADRPPFQSIIWAADGIYRIGLEAHRGTGCQKSLGVLSVRCWLSVKERSDEGEDLGKADGSAKADAGLMRIGITG